MAHREQLQRYRDENDADYYDGSIIDGFQQRKPRKRQKYNDVKGSIAPPRRPISDVMKTYHDNFARALQKSFPFLQENKEIDTTREETVQPESAKPSTNANRNSPPPLPAENRTDPLEDFPPSETKKCEGRPTSPTSCPSSDRQTVAVKVTPPADHRGSDRDDALQPEGTQPITRRQPTSTRTGDLSHLKDIAASLRTIRRHIDLKLLSTRLKKIAGKIQDGASIYDYLDDLVQLDEAIIY